MSDAPNPEKPQTHKPQVTESDAPKSGEAADPSTEPGRAAPPESEPPPKRRRAPVLIELDGPEAGEPNPGPKRQKPNQEAPSRRGTARPENRAQERSARDHGASARDPDPTNPADAPPIDDAPGPQPRPRTMEQVIRMAAGEGPSTLTRVFLGSAAALFTFLLSMAALSYIDRMMTRWPLLGWLGVGLFAVFTLAVLGLAWREYRAWGRFARIDEINRRAVGVLAANDLQGARAVSADLSALYANRPEAAWGRAELDARAGDQFDAHGLLALTETQLLAPLDAEARAEIEAAARSVAAATALIPLALVDVATALFANLRMIRRMAEIYGGRAGAVGGWRLARNVVAHLVATGAVAAGDDLIHTVAGGGVLAKVSRRFGEGVVNGALTARVGIAAMEVCRPLPFVAQTRPSVGQIVTRGLRGLFGADDSAGR